MGMGHAPCHGFLLEATEENLNKIGYDLEKLKEIISKMEFGPGRTPPDKDDLADFDSFMNYLGVELIDMELNFYGQEVKVQFMRYSREDMGDRYDTIEDGIFMQFDEESLYEKKLSNCGETMKGLGVFPEESQWTNFG